MPGLWAWSLATSVFQVMHGRWICRLSLVGLQRGQGHGNRRSRSRRLAAAPPTVTKSQHKLCQLADVLHNLSWQMRAWLGCQHSKEQQSPPLKARLLDDSTLIINEEAPQFCGVVAFRDSRQSGFCGSSARLQGAQAELKATARVGQGRTVCTKQTMPLNQISPSASRPHCSSSSDFTRN